MASGHSTFESMYQLDDDVEANYDENEFLNYDTPLIASDTPRFFADQFAPSPTPALHNGGFSVQNGKQTEVPESQSNADGQQRQPSLQPRSMPSSTSPESSADSSSDSSGRRKRKTPSYSPNDLDRMDTKESSAWSNGDGVTMAQYKHTGYRGDSGTYMDFNPSTTLNPKDLDMDAINNAASGLDIESAANSPPLSGRKGPQQNVNPAEVERRLKTGQVATQNYGLFHNRESSLGASPNALFNGVSPSSSSNVPYNNQMMDTSMTNPAWQFEPSPAHYASTSSVSPYTPSNSLGHSSHHQLHIFQMTTKSRVETQIAIKLTLFPFPEGVTKLHLPTHTISKPKLLNKDVPKDQDDTLELHTSLVCASAMAKPQAKKRALERAQSNEPPNLKKERRSSTTALQDSENPDDPNHPLNGGEVHICHNCINRERKRASRKRVKKQDDEELWNSYEKERVIVFNDKEYKEWAPPVPVKEPLPEGASSLPPDYPGAMQVEVPMRIACYCRHQGEKTGFQVIFTIKDRHGNLIAQNITGPILITDDHKTQPNTLPMYDGSQQSLTQPFMSDGGELQSGFSHRPYHSTNDLQALRHAMPAQGFYEAQQASQMPNYVSGTTSATMTPRNLSRQASPTAQVGPNKKRKPSSSHVHHRVPSGLAMTPVDTSLAMSMPGFTSAASASGISAGASPFRRSGGWDNNQSYIISPNSANGAYHTGPPTPNSFMPSGHFNRGSNADLQSYFSVPNSAHASRAPSPVSGNRPNMAAFQQPPQHQQPAHFSGDMSSLEMQRGQQQMIPRINRILPSEGPCMGGIEVTCLGSHFQTGMEVMFGDTPATTTTYWGASTLVCLLPPSAAPGTVTVTVRGAPQPRMRTTQLATFKYINDEERHLYELALKQLCQKTFGDLENFDTFVQGAAQGAYPSPVGGMMHNGLPSNTMNSMDMQVLARKSTEDALLRVLDMIDQDESPYPPAYDLELGNGSTMLALACSLGYSRFVAGLLARGANPDTRDRGGYTPLMVAARKGHVSIVRRLILKGADPTLRSLRGDVAVEMTASRECVEALKQFKHHTRSRSAGQAPSRSRNSSVTSVRSLWGPPSPTSRSGSFDYETEDLSDEPEEAIVASHYLQSRRASAVPEQIGLPLPPAVPHDNSALLAPAAAMAAWREQLSMQIQQFQQSVHWNFPNFQLPALPPLPNLEDYHAHPMVRRISSLVPQRTPPNRAIQPAADMSNTDYSWRDLFTTPTSPPAYEDIYPEGAKPQSMSDKKASLLQAVAETALDSVCAGRFDTLATPSSSSTMQKAPPKLDVRIGKHAVTKEQQEQLRLAHAQKLKRIRSDRNLFFIWIPLLIIVVCAMIHHSFPAVGPYIISSLYNDPQRQDAGRIVEVA